MINGLYHTRGDNFSISQTSFRKMISYKHLVCLPYLSLFNTCLSRSFRHSTLNILHNTKVNYHNILSSIFLWLICTGVWFVKQLRNQSSELTMQSTFPPKHNNLSKQCENTNYLNPWKQRTKVGECFHLLSFLEQYSIYIGYTSCFLSLLPNNIISWISNFVEIFCHPFVSLDSVGHQQRHYPGTLFWIQLCQLYQSINQALPVFLHVVNGGHYEMFMLG